MSTRFTFRALEHDGKDRADQAIWSAVPGSGDVERLRAVAERLGASDAAALLSARDEDLAAVYMQRDYPSVVRARFEIDAVDPVLDGERGILHVDVSARVLGLDAHGREVCSREYEHYARQVVVARIEREFGQLGASRDAK